MTENSDKSCIYIAQRIQHQPSTELLVNNDHNSVTWWSNKTEYVKVKKMVICTINVLLHYSQLKEKQSI